MNSPQSRDITKENNPDEKQQDDLPTVSRRGDTIGKLVLRRKQDGYTDPVRDEPSTK